MSFWNCHRNTKRARDIFPVERLRAGSAADLAVLGVQLGLGRDAEAGQVFVVIRRELSVWAAHHCNGWDTHVVETIDGEFAAWAAPRGTHGMTEYVERDELSAKAAAVYALERKTGHTQCSPTCSAWEWRTHVVDGQADARSDGPALETLAEDHKRLERQMRLLEQEHATLHDRPEDLPAHREHRTRLRQHLAQVRAHIEQLRHVRTHARGGSR